MKKQLLLSLALLMSLSIFAQRDFSKVNVTATKVTESIYMLQGSGGNIGVCIGDDGVFMIDDQFAPLSDKIKKAIAELSDKEIKFLLNTHWHGDHTGGNENFAKDGAIIVAHENVRTRMSAAQVTKAFSKPTPAAANQALPIVTFSDNMSFYMNGEDILAYHVHNAHTDGDAFVYFPKSNVIHMGDTFFKGRFPYIDIGSGGTVQGVLDAFHQVITICDADTKIIPGHGDLATVEDLKTSRNMIETVMSRVTEAIAQGQTIEEIKKADLSKEWDAEWGNGFINPEKWVDIIYTDLTRGEQE